MNRLSRSRDSHSGAGPRPGESFPNFIHRINEEWVLPTRRLSPHVIVDLLRESTEQVLAFWHDQDLAALGDDVSWAGPGAAPVWLDCARDFTEYWIHSQQIAEATGRVRAPDATEAAEIHLVLDVFLRAMPFTLRDKGHAGDELQVRVLGIGGGAWEWRHDGTSWRPRPAGQDGAPRTTIEFPRPRTLWALATRMLEPEQAAEEVRISGDLELADAALQILSIIR